VKKVLLFICFIGVIFFFLCLFIDLFIFVEKLEL